MKILKLVQGSPEWIAVRLEHFTASEAPAMMNESKYQKRSELLKMKKTGIEKTFDEFMLKKFSEGHAAEAAYRPIAEEIVGDTLFPVTGSAIVDGMPLLASFDGLTMMGDVGYEHKLYNAGLVADIELGDLAPTYYWQMEHQALVAGLERILFVTSDGTKEKSKTMWYESLPERRARLIAGWKQFAEDMNNYRFVVEAPKVVTGPVETLPAIFVTVEGRITDSNLPAFVQAAHEYIDRINEDLETDADYETAAKNVNELESGEKRLEAVKANALAQTSTIDELFRAIDQIKAEMKKKRLHLNDLVKTKKENRKIQIVTEARQSIENHIASLNKRIGGNWMPAASAAPFAEAIKGLKSIDSMREKVGNALRDMMWEASMKADSIEANRKSLIGEAHDWIFLFNDFPAVCQKPAEDFAAILAMRITAEEKRIESAREKIRAEERAKAEAEAQAKAKAEQDERDAKARAELEAKAKVDVANLIAKTESPTQQATALTTEAVSESVQLIKLGQICERLGFIVTAEFITSLGIQPTAQERSAKLYRNSDFTRICDALIAKVSAARNAQYQPQ